MFPTFPGIWSKLSQRWELNTSLTEGSARCSQQTLIICWGLLSLYGFLLFQRIQLTASISGQLSPFFTQVSKTCGQRSERHYYKVDHRPPVQGILVPSEHPYA
ncbi:hypothetical protein ILYODFUR_029425 [Ilyodon furcidens]|uniref:Uncharacterized protein n=1 Tax=Ilyodon furcidens TaxID=33524 RepID=A0ABV0SQ60_9TELE